LGRKGKYYIYVVAKPTYIMQTTLDTIDELAQGAIDDVADPDVRYKLRTIQQLIRALEQRDKDVVELLDNRMDEINDEEVIETLRSVGYLE